VRHRLEIANRGATLLERKLRALTGEHRRMADRARLSEMAWTSRAREARTWLLRAELFDGQRGLRLASADGDASVVVTWASTMGLRYPAQASYLPPIEGSPASAVVGSAALVRAEQAHRAAVEAALQHAADQAAVQRMSTEIAQTRQRVRALRQHWIPLLDEAANRLELELEERERGEAVARRWATAGR
jgi:V/A-type H+-transporting ATPase subunit D